MRLGDARGCGHGAVAETARAWIHGERSRRGRGIPEVAGMGQTPDLRGLGPTGSHHDAVGESRGPWAGGQTLELPELGPTGNGHNEAGESQGLRAWSSRRTCEGSDGPRTRTPTPRLVQSSSWGYGLTVPRNERSPFRGVCETLRRPDQVRRDTRTPLRCSLRVRGPFEAPFEPSLEPRRELRAMTQPKH